MIRVKSFELRTGGRYDKSAKSTFVSTVSENEDVNPFANSQTGFALQGVYKF